VNFQHGAETTVAKFVNPKDTSVTSPALLTKDDLCAFVFFWQCRQQLFSLFFLN
jgi:hypothetical protein